MFRCTERDVPCGRDARFATMCPADVKMRNTLHHCDVRSYIAMILHNIAMILHNIVMMLHNITFPNSLSLPLQTVFLIL